MVLGYSFGDDHINRVILNGLSVPSFRLVVFGSNNPNINKLIKLGDARITVINSEEKIQYFKNFVEKVLPSEHPDIKEEIQRELVNRLITKFEQGNENE